MIPPHDSSPTRSRVDRPRKSNFAKTDLFYEEMFDLETFGDATPFDDDELSTLEEFEAISKRDLRRDQGESAPKTSKKVEKKKKTDTETTKVLPPRRKKIKRRRQIDPSTCERDYSREEVEFMNALNEYKRSSGRMFPTCSEILEVLKNLGYEKKEDYTLESDEFAEPDRSGMLTEREKISP